jgi:hypothetical protein
LETDPADVPLFGRSTPVEETFTGSDFTVLGRVEKSPGEDLIPSLAGEEALVFTGAVAAFVFLTWPISDPEAALVALMVLEAGSLDTPDGASTPAYQLVLGLYCVW